MSSRRPAPESEKVHLPNLRGPESMKVGDEVVVKTSGTISGGLILGG